MQTAQSKNNSPMGALKIIFAFVLGVTALSLVASAIFPNRQAPASSAATDNSAARERLENKIHTQALVMLNLENTTVITSEDKLMVKLPRLTQRDVLEESISEAYRPILRAWMNALKADFAAAGVTNVCVYASAWDGLKICARPAGER